MKTPLLVKYIERLSSLNDQLCFFQFSRNELNKRLLDFSPNVGSFYTKDLFAQNIMAPRINVTISDLPKYQTLNETLTFGSYISTSYEVLSYYIEDSIDLLQKINPTTFQRTDDKQLEEKYMKTLYSSGCTLIDREIIDTIKYIRLRRNHFTHLSTILTEQVEKLINDQGTNLNTYWSSSISDLDFLNLNIFEFREQETIEILKLLRIIIDKLDLNLISNLSHGGIAVYFAERQFTSTPQRLNNDVIIDRISKLRKTILMESGLNISNTELEMAVRKFGVK